MNNRAAAIGEPNDHNGSMAEGRHDWDLTLVAASSLAAAIEASVGGA